MPKHAKHYGDKCVPEAKHTPPCRLVNAIESYLVAEKEIEKINERLLGYEDRDNKQAKYLEVASRQHENSLDYALNLISECVNSKDRAIQYLNAYSENKLVFFELYESHKKIEAAAPELLEALEAAWNEAGDLSQSTGHMIRKALDKARGQS